MEPRNEIAVELRALSELVSGIGPGTPYRVPDGYFDQLPALICSRIAGSPAFQLPADSPTFPAPSDSPTFQVPEGYFDGLAAQVLSRLKAGETNKAPAESAAEELAGLSPMVAAIRRETPYRLPEGYFEELSPVLTIIKERPAYEVPADYFGELSPVLSVAREGATYRVPDGYFETLPAEIAAKLGQEAVQPAARVIPMRRRDDRVAGHRVLKSPWWKYSAVAAVAACFLLIFSWPQPDGNGGRKGTAAPDVTQSLQKVSDQEIEAYLDDQHSFVADPAANSTATLDMNEGEVKSLLGEVSDSDLQQYMEEHGKEEDIATN